MQLIAFKLFFDRNCFDGAIKFRSLALQRRQRSIMIFAYLVGMFSSPTDAACSAYICVRYHYNLLKMYDE